MLSNPLFCGDNTFSIVPFISVVLTVWPFAVLPLVSLLKLDRGPHRSLDCSLDHLFTSLNIFPPFKFDDSFDYLHPEPSSSAQTSILILHRSDKRPGTGTLRVFHSVLIPMNCFVEETISRFCTSSYLNVV